MTAEYGFAFSRHAFVRGIQFRLRAPRERAQGRPGARRTRGSRALWVAKMNAHERTGEAEAVRPSLRDGFNAYAVLSLVSGFLATITGRDAQASSPA